MAAGVHASTGVRPSINFVAARGDFQHLARRAKLYPSNQTRRRRGNHHGVLHGHRHCSTLVGAELEGLDGVGTCFARPATAQPANFHWIATANVPVGDELLPNRAKESPRKRGPRIDVVRPTRSQWVGGGGPASRYLPVVITALFRVAALVAKSASLGASWEPGRHSRCVRYVPVGAVVKGPRGP